MSLSSETLDLSNTCEEAELSLTSFSLPQYAVKVRRHTPWSRVRCHGCRFTHSRFHSWWYSLCITLKYTILVRMRISPDEPARHDNGASDVWALTAYKPMDSLQNVYACLCALNWQATKPPKRVCMYYKQDFFFFFLSSENPFNLSDIHQHFEMKTINE